MIKFCPNCGSCLSSKKDGMKKLAQGCKHCTVCHGTYYIIETSIPTEGVIEYNNKRNFKNNKL